MKNKNGIDIEITEKEIEEYATCTSRKKPSSYIGCQNDKRFKIIPIEIK